MYLSSCLNSNSSALAHLSTLMQGSGSQMANNCNLIKSVRLCIVSNSIVTGSSMVFCFYRNIARNVILAGLDIELLKRTGFLNEVMWEG